MAYNNMFPTGYVPYYPQYVQPQAQASTASQQQNSSGIIWVQGEAGAKSYLVAPNTTIQLWDSESQTIYLKSADGSGMPSMKILDYTIRENATNQNTPVSAQNASNFDNYVTREEFHSLEAKLSKRLDKIAYKAKHSEEVDDDV